MWVIVRWGGKALFIGAGLGSNTTFHCAEDWMGMPFLTTERALVRFPDGSREVTVCGSPQGCRAYYKGGGEPAQQMEAAGRVRRTDVNGAAIRLVAARDVIRFCGEAEERQPGWLLCRQAPHDFCRRAMEACIRHRPAILRRVAALRAGEWAPAGNGWE